MLTLGCMAKTALISFETTMFNLFFKLHLEARASRELRELMIAAFETYGVLVYRYGAVQMGVSLHTDPISPLSIMATFYVLLIG